MSASKTSWRLRWGAHLAQLTTAWYQARPLAPGTGLGLWIAGRAAHRLGLALTLREGQ